MRNKQSDQQLSAIDGLIFNQILRRYTKLLAENEQLLNDLNVFPVPDSDTGTNSLLTMQSSLIHVDKGKKDAAVVAKHAADDAGQNARGNSGVILAEYLRGFAEYALPELDVNLLHECLQNAGELAQNSVAAPREGTMLTVAHAVSRVECADSLGEFVEELSLVARKAVHDSTELIEELKVAGVVDAGALALSMFFDAMHEVINKQQISVIELAQTSCDVTAIDYRGPDFEVMFNFKGDAQSLREELALLGDSLTITGPPAKARFHIHVDNPTEAIMEAMRHGMASRIVIQELSKSVRLQADTTDAVGVVIALEGAGLTKQAQELGAQCVSLAGDASIGEIEAAIRNTNKRNVIVLPSALDNHAACAIAAHNLRAEGITAKVIPTRTVPHSLAALAVFDSSANLQTNLDSMARAAHSTRSGCVLTNAQGVIEGYLDGTLVESSMTTSADDMLTHIVEALLNEGGELVTVLVGEQGSMTHVHLTADHVGIDFDFINGGQATSTYLVGVE